MFAGIGGFRSGLEAIGGFECVGYCEIDKYAKQAYDAIYDTGGELYFDDARKIVPEQLPDFDLLLGGFPCQSFSIAGARKGFDDTCINAVEIAKIIEDAGAAAVAVHGRTREQYYSGTADWEIIRQVKEAVSIPVIGNGDVTSPQKAEELVKQTGCDGIMIARAAAERPWIFAQIKNGLEDSAEKITVDRMQTALNFIDNVEKFQPKEFHKTRIQRFFSYYCAQFEFGHYFQTKMLNYKSNEESRKEIRDYFQKQPHERFIQV